MSELHLVVVGTATEVERRVLWLYVGDMQVVLSHLMLHREAWVLFQPYQHLGRGVKLVQGGQLRRPAPQCLPVPHVMTGHLGAVVVTVQGHAVANCG